MRKKKMMKVTNLLGVVLLAAAVLISCTDSGLKAMTYSNMTDSGAQESVCNALEGADIPGENVERLMKNVAQFNQAAENNGLVKDGFADMSGSIPEYNQEKLQELWSRKYPDFPGINCRITAYSLLKDSITVGTDGTGENGKSSLFLDAEAIDTAPEKLFSRDEKEKFFTLFSAVPTALTKDRAVHLKKVKDAWHARGVTFKNEKASLITVWIHDYIDEDENELFVGHAGVLVPTSDHKLLFVEKLAFQEPFQATVFESRKQLCEYLMAKYDVEWEQPTAKPFIMENDELMAENE